MPPDVKESRSYTEVVTIDQCTPQQPFPIAGTTGRRHTARIETRRCLKNALQHGNTRILDIIHETVKLKNEVDLPLTLTVDVSNSQLRRKLALLDRTPKIVSPFFSFSTVFLGVSDHVASTRIQK